MNITLSNFNADDLAYSEEYFSNMINDLDMPLDESPFIHDYILGGDVTYDDILKLSQNIVTFRMMVILINYFQSRSKQIWQFCLAFQKAEVLKQITSMNEQMKLQQQPGQITNYCIILYWQTRWVAAIYMIKSSTLEIVDLQGNKTKDALKKLFETILKEIGKLPIKTTIYTQQEDKLTDGGVYILNYLWQVYAKVQAFVKLSPQEKLLFHKKLQWLTFEIEKLEHVEYPELPSIAKFKEADIKTFKFSENPVAQQSYTGIEVLKEDYDNLTNGKSSTNMMAFWSSYIYAFDKKNPNPLLLYFIIHEDGKKIEQFEKVFQPRRVKKNHEYMVIIKNIGRWIFAIHQLQKSLLTIIDLQYKEGKEKYKAIFDTTINSYADSSQIAIVNYITQSYTDQSDGSEYVINFLWAFINGQPLDKIKFGFLEKKSLRLKLLWVLVKLNQGVIGSHTSIKSRQNTTVRPSSTTSIQLDNKLGKSILKNGASPSNSLINTPINAGGDQTNSNRQIQPRRFGRQQAGETPQAASPQKTMVGGLRSRLNATSPQQSMVGGVNRNATKYQQDDNKSETSIIQEQVKRGMGSRAATKFVKDTNKPNIIVETKQSQEDEEDDELEKIAQNQLEEQQLQQLFIRKQQSSKQLSDESALQLNSLEQTELNMKQYYHELLNDEVEEVDLDRLKEIYRTMANLQKLLQKKQQLPIDNILDSLNITRKDQSSNFEFPTNIINYSTIIHDDRYTMKILREILDQDDFDQPISLTLKKRKELINGHLPDIDNIQEPFFLRYDFPKKEIKQQDVTKSSVPILPKLQPLTYSTMVEEEPQKILEESRSGQTLPPIKPFHKNRRF